MIRIALSSVAGPENAISFAAVTGFAYAQSPGVETQPGLGHWRRSLPRLPCNPITRIWRPVIVRPQRLQIRWSSSECQKCPRAAILPLQQRAFLLGKAGSEA